MNSETAKAPIVEQVFYGNLTVVLQYTMVNNPVSTFADNILGGEAIRRSLKLSQSIPMSPAQMRNSRDHHRNLISAASVPISMGTRPNKSFWVRNPMILAYFDIDSMVPHWTLFVRRWKQGLMFNARKWVGLRRRVCLDWGPALLGVVMVVILLPDMVDSDLLDLLGYNWDCGSVGRFVLGALGSQP